MCHVLSFSHTFAGEISDSWDSFPWVVLGNVEVFTMSRSRDDGGSKVRPQAATTVSTKHAQRRVPLLGSPAAARDDCSDSRPPRTTCRVPARGGRFQNQRASRATWDCWNHRSLTA